MSVDSKESQDTLDALCRCLFGPDYKLPPQSESGSPYMFDRVVKKIREAIRAGEEQK